MRMVCRWFAASLCLMLSACFLAPHKIDIQQGNYLDQTMLSKLKVGMNKSQVRYVLGTPLIADPFHPERWDYTFLDRPKGKLKQQRRVTVVFDAEERLARLEGDVPSALNLQSGELPAPAQTQQKGG